MALFTEVCTDDPIRLRDALAGVRAYQDNPWKRELVPQPEAGRMEGVCLRDFGGDGSLVVFVPSLINPPTVLDLDHGNSMLRWLGTQGLHPLLVDWGSWSPDEMALGFDAIISERLVPLLRNIGEPVALVGYCLGGLLALGAATQVAPARLALLATPWHFSGYAPEQRADIAAHHASVAPLLEVLGCLPMDLLQPMFWALDRDGVVDKFAALGERDPASPTARAFIALEDWANDGPPLPLGVARELFGDLFAGDLTGRGAWQIGGASVEPARLGIPILDVVAMRDRIVPAATALGLGQRLELDAGHVGMVVGSRAPKLLWEPLARWLREA